MASSFINKLKKRELVQDPGEESAPLPSSSAQMLPPLEAGGSGSSAILPLIPSATFDWSFPHGLKLLVFLLSGSVILALRSL